MCRALFVFLGLALLAVDLCMPAVTIARDFPPGADQAVHREGIKYASEGKFDDAKDWFEKNLETNKTDNTSQGALMLLKDLNKGRISREYAIAVFKGLNFLQDGSREQAINVLEQAIKLKPRYAKPYNILAIIYSSTDDIHKAVEYFQKAVEVNPKYSEAYFNLAALYQSLGQPEDAINFYKKAVELEPNFSEAVIHIAALCASLGKYDEAAGYYQDAIKIDRSNPETYYNLALVYFISGKVIKFKDNLLKAQELFRQRNDENGLHKVEEYMHKIEDLEKKIGQTR